MIENPNYPKPWFYFYFSHRYAPNKCKWKGKQRRPSFGTKNNIIKTKLKNKKSMRDVIAALTKPES